MYFTLYGSVLEPEGGLSLLQNAKLPLMRRLKVFGFLTALSLFLAGCSFPAFPQAQSGVYIDSTPGSTVFIDDQQVGTTPFENKKLKPGEIDVRLVPQATSGATLVSWEGKVRLTPGIQTILRRAFAETQVASSGVLLSFDRIGGKSASLSVVSTPDAASVKVDGQYQGFTPVALESIPVGDHQILLSAPGYQDQLVNAKSVAGYRLIVSAQLAQLATPPPASASPTPNPSGSPSPKTSPTPTPSPGGSPRPTQAALPAKPYVLISDTPTGWLRVRAEASSSSQEVAKVYPGEGYPYKDISTDNNWFQIEYKTNSLGWVSTQYAKKVE